MPRRSRKNRSPDHDRPAAPSLEAKARKREALAAAGVCVFLLAAVMLVFGQTLRRGFGFVNFDDFDYVFSNNNVKGGLTPRAVQWAFSTDHGSNWHPLTWLSHMLDCQIYGPHADAGSNGGGAEQTATGCSRYEEFAPGHHLNNVLVHAANAILLFLLLWRMTGALWPSAFAAAVFALHPLRAESVAWVSERKDVLSGLFFLLTLAAYVGYARRPFSLLRYLAVVVLFALGLMAKPMLVTLPFVLLLLDYWPLRRFPRGGGADISVCPSSSDSPGRQECLPHRRFVRLIAEKLPLLALAAASCAATLWAQRAAIAASERIDFPSRVANAAVSLVGYLLHWLYPANLVAMYPYPYSGLPAGRVAVALLVLAAISLAVAALWRRRPYLLVGWLWYLGMLVPVIGLVQVGTQSMADRYTYLPLIGPTVALSWLATRFAASSPRWRLPAAAIACLILLDLILLTSQQVSYWRDSQTLWSHALDCDADNWRAHHGLGAALLESQQYDKAIAECSRSLELRPCYAPARASLGRALEHRGARGDIEAAIEQYRQAITDDPTVADVHYNLGVLLAGRGHADEAIAEFRSAVKCKPEHASAHYNLAVCLQDQGKYAEALRHWATVAQLQPESVDAVDDLAWRLATYPDASLRDGQRAIALAEQAIQLSKGEAAKPLSTLAAAYAETGRFAEAVETAKRAIDVAMQHGETAVADDIRAQIDLYRANRPYHGSPGQQ